MKGYEEKVYAGILGKTIGVYMGRPIEGWRKERIRERFPTISGYLHEALGEPLVVSDDDISGTTTFVRVLEDSGLYESTPEELYGDNWLNYIVPDRTILWWGGMGVSTEHTAFLRLKAGYKAPESGSASLNGAGVAGQIGAQIFIDCFGMVCPGEPDRAARLAERAGRVSHDIESVDAAKVVAAMVSIAFVETDMTKILDGGISVIAEDSAIARIHQDVRAWSAGNEDWEDTYELIREKYGYQHYNGNCHVVPNHAIMVMAWCHAPDSFFRSQQIINAAGWDTDCNAANVGSVMGIKCGLEGINAEYDFQKPFADRLIIPTADGTRFTTDCLQEALAVAVIGRRVMGWKPAETRGSGVIHHFSLPGALHGYLPECGQNDTPNPHVSNIEVPDGERGMLIEARELTSGAVCQVSTPVFHAEKTKGYRNMGCSRIVSGMTLSARGHVLAATGSDVTVNMFARYLEAQTSKPSAIASGPAVAAVAGEAFEAHLTVPDTRGYPVTDIGFEIRGVGRGTVRCVIDTVSRSGPFHERLDDGFPVDADGQLVGWIDDMDTFPRVLGHNEPGAWCFGRNTGRGHQGLQRYLALVKTPESIKVVRMLYGEETLFEQDVRWETGEFHQIRIVAKDRKVRYFVDESLLYAHSEDVLLSGGAGLLVQSGVAGIRSFDVEGHTIVPAV
jgi:ADP-ribosylglycohydrolase